MDLHLSERIGVAVINVIKKSLIVLIGLKIVSNQFVLGNDRQMPIFESIYLFLSLVFKRNTSTSLHGVRQPVLPNKNATKHRRIWPNIAESDQIL